MTDHPIPPTTELVLLGEWRTLYITHLRNVESHGRGDDDLYERTVAALNTERFCQYGCESEAEHLSECPIHCVWGRRSTPR